MFWRRKLKKACICALYKAYTGERAWTAIGDRRQATYVGSNIIGKSEPENKEQISENTLV
jgi:hypothetical protein